MTHNKSVQFDLHWLQTYKRISSQCCLFVGKVLVHCTVGVSRSATLVLAYLMIRQNLTLVEAIKTVKDHRGVIPNRGFLRQLNGLDGILRESRKTSPQS